MATINKDFRVKHGLVVEGTTATVDGNDVITQGGTTDLLDEGSTNLYYTDGRVRDVLADSTTDDLDEGSTSLYFTDARALSATASAYDASGSASSAQAAAESYANGLVGDASVDGTAGNTVADRIGSAVSDLVGGAPVLLDTLNELANALADDAAFSATVTTSIGEKLAKAGDTMSGDLTLAGNPTEELHAAPKQYVDNSIDALDTDAIEEGSTNSYFTDARAVDALEAVVPNFTSVDINSVLKQVAATINLATTAQTAVYSFAKASYRSAKFIVKSAHGNHTELSEILVTLDASDNVAITEYAIVSTNGSLSEITVGVTGANIEILATAGTANTDVTVSGTLIL
jgi:hypothetical protein